MKPICYTICILFLIPFGSLAHYKVSHRYWQKERIITDLRVINSPRGVRIDYSYSEPTHGHGKLNSVPGCPKSIEGYPWVYYGNRYRASCYLTGQQGPCAENERLYLKKGSSFGVCKCSCFLETRSYPEDLGLPVSSPNGRYTLCLDQVQDNGRNVCYDFFTRGPCGPKQILVKNKSGTSVICVRKCDFGKIYNSTTGRCEDAMFGPPIIGNTCGPGKKYSDILKKCVLVWPNKGILLG